MSQLYSSYGQVVYFLQLHYNNKNKGNNKLGKGFDDIQGKHMNLSQIFVKVKYSAMNSVCVHRTLKCWEWEKEAKWRERKF